MSFEIVVEDLSLVEFTDERSGFHNAIVFVVDLDNIKSPTNCTQSTSQIQEYAISSRDRGRLQEKGLQKNERLTIICMYHSSGKKW